MHHRSQSGCYCNGTDAHPHDSRWRPYGRLLRFSLFLSQGFTLLPRTISFYRDRCLRCLACADAWHATSGSREQGMSYGLLLLARFDEQFLLFPTKFDLFNCQEVLFGLILLRFDLQCLNIQKYLSVFPNSSWTHQDPLHEIIIFSWFFEELRLHFLTPLTFYACFCIVHFFL